MYITRPTNRTSINLKYKYPNYLPMQKVANKASSIRS